MSLLARQTRCPRPFDPDLGAEARAHVPEAYGDLVAGVAGCSPFLAGLIAREGGWLEGALTDPEAALSAQAAALAETAPDEIPRALRIAKRRVALLTALCDLAGVWPLEQVTGALTEFADMSVTLAYRAALWPEIRRRKLPGAREADLETLGGIFALAMGKMGAGELNYSSDIDLICLFDETRYAEEDFQEARASLVRATRKMAALLSERAADGYVFRTDLRLRPDPAVTPVCMSAAAAESYYESLGRTWERAAYIKARPAAGDVAAGERFISGLRPFIWRRHLDFAAIEDAHAMRLAIREHKGTGGPITLPGHDMKLGRGGIREIEFFTQTRQLIAGGRDPELRLRGTCAGLAALAEKGWVPQEVATTLTEHYRAHREIEHRVQMVHDAQTHLLPRDDEGFARLAAMQDCSVDALKEGLHARLDEVHALTEDFFAPDAAPAAPQPAPAGLDEEVLARWPSYPALRSDRAGQIFARLRPEILTRLSAASAPAEALGAFDTFLAGLPAGVQLLSLFEANPSLLGLLIDVVTVAPELSGYLSRHAQVLDGVIGGDFFAPWSGVAAMTEAATAAITREHDYETRLDALRRWHREAHFRIGVHLLRGLIDAGEAGAQYSDLARATLAAIWPVVEAEFAAKYGPPPGRGAVVLGMGSLGAGRLTPTSDLDLIVIYDPEEAEMSAGPKSLAVRPYYARLAQALVTALSAQMAEGRLYEVDMRLRPSGSQGPVATSWTAFQSYQREEAWVWEHLALTRAEPLAGSPALGADVEAFRQALLGQEAREKVRSAVAEMRARLAGAKPQDGPWDAKQGAGRMQDIELLSQAGALLDGRRARSVADGLAGAVAQGLVEDAAPLLVTYDLLWRLVTATRLIGARRLVPDEIGQAGRDFVLRTCGAEDFAALEAALGDQTRAAAALIDAALAEEKA